jgi:hypothetical protein
MMPRAQKLVDEAFSLAAGENDWRIRQIDSELKHLCTMNDRRSQDTFLYRPRRTVVS